MTMNHQEIDGFEVSWSVVQDAAGQFKLNLTTRRLDEAEVMTWDVPGARLFSTASEAERHGRYVSLGLRGVKSDGAPIYTVV